MHEVRQRIRRTAEAWCAYAPGVPDDHEVMAWAMQVLHDMDGGELETGMTLAQYDSAVRDWVCVLRTTGAYPKDRAHAELAAWRAVGL